MVGVEFDRDRRGPRRRAVLLPHPPPACSSAIGMGAGGVGDAHRAQDRSSSTTSGCCWLCFVLLLRCSCRASAAASTARGAGSTWACRISRRSRRSSCCYIVWLASYLVRFRDEVNATWGAMLKPLGVAVGLVALLLLQPDFGSSSLILAITAGMLVLGGVQHAAHVRPGAGRPAAAGDRRDRRAVPRAPPDLVPRSVGGPVQAAATS